MYLAINWRAFICLYIFWLFRNHMELALPADVILPILDLVDPSTPYKLSKYISHLMYTREVVRAQKCATSKRRLLKTLLRRGDPALYRYMSFVDMNNVDSRLYVFHYCFKYPSELSLRILSEHFGRMPSDRTYKVRNYRRLLESPIGQLVLAHVINATANSAFFANLIDGKMLRSSDKDRYITLLESVEGTIILDALATGAVSFKRFSFLDTHAAFFVRSPFLGRFTRLFFAWRRKYPSLFSIPAMRGASDSEFFLTILEIEKRDPTENYRLSYPRLWAQYVERDNTDLSIDIRTSPFPQSPLYGPECMPSRLRSGWWKDELLFGKIAVADWTNAPRSYVERRPELFAALLAEGHLPKDPSFQKIVTTFLPIHHKRLDMLDDANKERYVNWINTAHILLSDEVREQTTRLIPKLSLVWARALAMSLTRCATDNPGMSISQRKQNEILQMSQCILAALRRMCDLTDTQSIDFPVGRLLDVVPGLVDSKSFVRLIRTHYWHLAPELPMVAASKLLEEAIRNKDFALATWIRNALTPLQQNAVIVYHSNNKQQRCYNSASISEGSQEVVNFLFESVDANEFDFAQYIKRLRPGTKGLAFITSSVFWQGAIKYLYECNPNDGETLLTFLTCGFSDEAFAEFVQRLKAYPDFQVRKAAITKTCLASWHSSSHKLLRKRSTGAFSIGCSPF